MKVMNELRVFTVILAFLALGLNLAVKNMVTVPDELETKFTNGNQVVLSVPNMEKKYFKELL